MATDADMAFVHSSWLGAYRRACPDFSDPAYYAAIRKRIARLLEQGARIAIACDPSSEGYIVGWACFGPGAGVVHFVYVRDIERRRGTARDLVENILRPHKQQTVYATHTTKYLEAIARTHREILVEPSKMERPREKDPA
jgi:GNAT superfamily N-acetyltransferase